MMAPEPQRWARSPPHLAWKRPSLPTHWVRVLERHPDGIAAEPGYVWLDMPGKGELLLIRRGTIRMHRERLLGHSRTLRPAEWPLRQWRYVRRLMERGVLLDRRPLVGL